MFINFRWRGEPIYDIEKWAAERNEPMVKVKETTKDAYGYIDIQYYNIPKCFADGMCVYQGCGGGSVSREIVEDA